MAKVILQQIGSAVESFMDPQVFQSNMAHMETLNRRYIDAREEFILSQECRYINIVTN